MSEEPSPTDLAFVESLPTMDELLDLERLDRDLYRGINEVPDNGRSSLYGGQVAAQALRAAGLTVTPDRYPHSMHGYFLRPGRRDIPVVYKVDRDRDGRSFSARRVVAVQDGEVLFNLTASFHVEREGAEYTLPWRVGVPAPVDCEPEIWAHNAPLADALEVPRVPLVPGGIQRGPAVWIKTKERLGDDRLMHCCALTYMSDIGSGFRNLGVPGLSGGGSTLDHSMWFRRQIRADEWCLMELWPFMAGGGRGLYGGSIHAADGTHGVMMTQEMLLREWNG